MRGLRTPGPNNHILNYNYNNPKPKYLIIGYMDPLGKVYRISGLGLGGLGFERKSVADNRTPRVRGDGTLI